MGTSIVNQFWFYIGFIFFNLEDCKEYYWAKLYQNDVRLLTCFCDSYAYECCE